MVYEITIKVSATSLLAVVKAAQAKEYVVTFAGSRSLSGLADKVRRAVRNPDQHWRPDQYHKS